MSGQSQGNGPRRPVGDRPRTHSRSTDAERAILEATERLLETTSLGDLSVAQIIGAAGISRATFYFYFGSKFAVLTALVDQVVGEILNVTREARSQSRGLAAGAALRQRISASAGVWQENRAVLQATVENWNAIPELRTVWLSALERLTVGIAAEIDRERSRGRAPAGPDSGALAATLVWTTERCLYVAGLELPGSLAGDEDTVDALSRIWLGAMYGAAGDDPPAA